MKTALGDNAVAIVKRSLPLMERHRGGLQRAIGRTMARRSPHDRAGRDQAAGRVILDMLFDHARRLDGGRPWPRLDDTARRHRQLGLATADYARFGDGLGAAMKDVLGDDASPPLLWAWGDAYWAIVRATRKPDLPLAA